MTKTDFHELPRDLQDRFRWATRGELGPEPLLHQPATRRITAVWLGLSAVAALSLAAIWGLGFGQLDHPLARHPTGAMAVYVLLVAALAYGVLRAMAYELELRRLPFAPGLYLFGASLIDARDRTLRVVDVAELTAVTTRGPSLLELQAGARRFRFYIDPAHLESAEARVRAARARVAGGIDAATRSELDPLQRPPLESPLSPASIPPPAPLGWPRHAWWLAAAIGLSGIGLFHLRDDASDARMFKAARARDDAAAYRRYLERAGDHAEAIRREHLPRAELRAAVEAGTVDAIDRLIARHPDHAIEAEIRRARRAAVAAAFEQARAKETLEALLAFAERHPDHHLGERWRRAREKLYTQAHEAFAAELAPGATDGRDVGERLAAWAEREGPTRTDGELSGPAVEVRAQRLPSRAVDKANDLVKLNPYYVGERSLPSRHLAPKPVAPIAGELSTSLAAAFDSHWSAEILTFTAGAPIEDAQPISELDRPTLVVSYRIEPSGQNYASRKPRGIFIGVVLFADVTLHIPDGGEPVSSRQVVAEPIPIALIADHEPGDDPIEPELYTTMLERAFAKLEARYLAEWFRAPT